MDRTELLLLVFPVQVVANGVNGGFMNHLFAHVTVQEYICGTNALVPVHLHLEALFSL